MSKTTEVSGKGIRDGSIQRRDIDITTTGESMVTRLVAGTGISLSSTGADSGTGEVTVTATSAQYQANNTWLGWRNAFDLFFLDNLKVDTSDNLIINAEKYLDNPATPGPDVTTSNIFFQINKQNALCLTSDSTLKVYPTNFLIHGVTADGSDNQSITITPADATTDFSSRGASIRLFGNEHALTAGNLILESGTKSNSDLVLNAAATGGQIQLKISSNDVLTLSQFLIAAKQNVTLLTGNVNNLPLSFTGDTNTGLFSSGADSLSLVTGGQSRLAIDSSGLVGLSESSPGARLQVNTAVSSTKGLIVKGAASQSANLIEAQNSAGTVIFSVSASGAITGTLPAGSVPGLATVATTGDYNDLINKPSIILQSEKAVANGVATLNSSGQVPSSQLPSYVDDVLEYASLAAFPATGETGKIYVAQDTNKIYRWTGSAYIEISPTVGNSDTATKLSTPRSISAVGDATWSVNFDGSSNVSGTLTLANSGVTAGTYTKLTVDAKGRATSGTTLSATDIPSLDASKITSGVFDTARIPSNISITGNAATATKLATARNINGVSFDGTANITITANTTNTLTFGDGLNSDSFNGSAAKTVSVNSTVVRTSGNQTIDGTKTFSSTISGSVSGTASNITGTLAIANGGTGQTSAQAAINAITGASAATSGHLLTRNASGNAVWSALATVPISTGGTGQTSAQAAINALTSASSATSGYVLTRDASGNAVWAAPAASSVAASSITGQTGMWTSTNRPGASRLYRRDDDSGYNVQTHWTGTLWRLYGYNGNTAHADTHVGYADSAGYASSAGGAGNFTATGYIASAGQMYIQNVSPTLYLQDSNNRSAMIHCNSNVFYILRGDGVNSQTWATLNGYWPLELDLETNKATFGGTIWTAGNVEVSATLASDDVSSWGDLYLSNASGSNLYMVNIARTGGNSGVLNINSNGRVFVPGSSIRYKTNVEDVTDEQADRLFQLRPVTYQSKEPTDEQEPTNYRWYGLIAEEVAEIEPKLVYESYTEDSYEEITTEHGEKRRVLKPNAVRRPEGVNYEKISILLINVAKRQKSKIEELETRLAALEQLILNNTNNPST